MDRTSDTAIEIINDLHTERLDYKSEYIPLIDCAIQCQAYEDTGLTPEEIKSREYDRPIDMTLGVSHDRLRELAAADRDGRVAVLDGPRKPLVWGEDEHDTILCPYCGEYIDGKKAITRAEAEVELEMEAQK